MAGPLTFRPMDRVAAQAVLAWRYDPPYDVYNPPATTREEDVVFMADPANRYYAIEGPAGDLIAFCCHGPDAQVPGGDYSEDALDVGMGLRPDLTGQGMGYEVALAVLEHARQIESPARVRVTVARFNQRALRVWEKAGFERVTEFARTPDGMPFIVLERALGSSGQGVVE